jgi:rod shape determining protein RodA
MSRTELTGKGIDWTLLSIYLSLIVIGWVMIYSVDKQKFIADGIINFDSNAGKHFIFIAISLILFLFVNFLDWKFWKIFAYSIYVVSLFLLVAVLIFGVTIKGQKSWFSIGSSTFQPSELAKFGTCLALSSYLSLFTSRLKETKNQLIAFGILGAPIFLIMLQPDFGSALVFISFLILMFRNGQSPWVGIFILSLGSIFILSLLFPLDYLILALLLIAVGFLAFNFPKPIWGITGLVFLIPLSIWSILIDYQNIAYLVLSVIIFVLIGAHIKKRRGQIAVVIGFGLSLALLIGSASRYTFDNILKPHQQERLNVWLHPEKCDPRGSLYNILQSKMAIGSGGWEGKGFTNGLMTKLNYIPEQNTDFIFCTIGEEHGFIGSVVLIGLFVWLLIQLVNIAERQRSNFSRNYIYGIASIIFFHFVINIGMTIGLVPIIGIPLPFISSGGTSLLSFSLMIAVVIKLDSMRYTP